MQASLTRKHDRAIVARSRYAACPVAERLYQKFCNSLREFCVDILMKNKMFTYVGYLNKHIKGLTNIQNFPLFPTLSFYLFHFLPSRNTLTYCTTVGYGHVFQAVPENIRVY